MSKESFGGALRRTYHVGGITEDCLDGTEKVCCSLSLDCILVIAKERSEVAMAGGDVVFVGVDAVRAAFLGELDAKPPLA